MERCVDEDRHNRCCDRIYYYNIGGSTSSPPWRLHWPTAGAPNEVTGHDKWKAFLVHVFH